MFLPFWRTSIFLLIFLLLVGCQGKTPSTPIIITATFPLPTHTLIPLTPTSSPTNSPTATPLVLRPYHWEKEGFAFDLPINWQVSDPILVEMGTLYQIGTEPLGPGPYSSTLLVINKEQWDIQGAANQLACGDNCTKNTLLEEVTIGTLTGYQTIIGQNSITSLQWYFVEQDNQILLFSLHDPASLLTLEAVVQSIRFTPTLPTSTPTQTHTPIPPAHTQSSQTPTQMFTPQRPTEQPDGPVAFISEFYESIIADPSGENSYSYLSPALQEQLPTSTALLTQLNLPSASTFSFNINWLETFDNKVRFQTILNFSGQRRHIIHLTVIFIEGSWFVDNITVIPPTPTLTPTITSTIITKVTPTITPTIPTTSTP